MSSTPSPATSPIPIGVGPGDSQSHCHLGLTEGPPQKKKKDSRLNKQDAIGWVQGAAYPLQGEEGLG